MMWCAEYHTNYKGFKKIIQGSIQDPMGTSTIIIHTHSHTLTSFQFPEHPYGDLLDKVLLYHHSIEDALVPLGANDPIEDGSIIEIILKGGWSSPNTYSGRAICTCQFLHSVYSIIRKLCKNKVGMLFLL